MRAGIALCLLVACRPPGYGKHHGEVDAAAVESPDAQPPDAPAGCQHAFRLDGHQTSMSVWLTGDFVMWAGTLAGGAIAFAQGADGGWTVTHAFAAGTYQYKLIIDGTTWIADPTNANTVDDGFGGKNSVFTCAP